MTSAKMTELEAVNTILSSIGRGGLLSLDAANSNADGEDALRELHQSSRDLQESGWTFNTETDLVLDPSVDGTIALPDGTLKVRTSGKDYPRRFVDRGGKLYDRLKHTFAIAEPITVTLVLLLDFEDLPASARQLITVRAARRFALKKLGSTSAGKLVERDEAAAVVAFDQDEAENDNRTLAEASPHVVRMRRK